jgi:hypothetical protein
MNKNILLTKQVPVAHVCNSSYLGGYGWEITIDPISNNSLAWWSMPAI